MVRKPQEDSSTDMCTASSSEDAGCSQRNPTEAEKVVNNHIKIEGHSHHIAIGSGASVASKTEEDAARTANSDITAHYFDAAEHLKNPSALLDAVNKCRGTEKDNIEKYILQGFFPDVEKHAINAASSYNDSLELLARFSSPDLNSPRLAVHSLTRMKRLLDTEFGHCESANAHIIAVERILRQPFVDGSFARELQHNQRRRAEVYNSVLALVLLYLAKGHLKHPYIEKKDKEEIKEAVSKNINKSLQRNPRPQKDRWRYSMETMLNLIERLFDYKRLIHMSKLLDLCKDIRHLEAFFKTLHSTESDSVDQFVILKMFHGKLCNNDDGACQVVQNIIMNHHVFSKQWQHRNENWQFVLLACQTLLYTINSGKLSKATRIRAARCLASLTEAKAYRKSNIIRYIIEKHCIKTAFARDLESRKIVIERFDKGFQDEILRRVLINQICKTHESKCLEYSETIYEDEDRLIKRGLYDHQPAAITVAKPYSAEYQDLSTSGKHLQNETRVLQHLNQTANEHVPMVFAADTETRPFHMICEYMPKQDLLQFLRGCIEDQHPPTYRQLLQICLGIAKCMIFIHNKQVIHKQLLPQHVLLDDDYKVKITGFWDAKILSTSEMQGGILGEKLSFDDPSIRFAPPECLEDEPLFSPESDVWSFGVLMYVIFTCGGTPYANQDTKDIHQHVLSGRSLTKDWLRDDIFSLIQKCMGEKRKDRISFQKVSEDLQKLLDGKDADEWVTIPETVPKKDDESNDDDPKPTEEENPLGIPQLMVNSNSVLSNPGGFRPPLKNKMKRSSSVSCREGHLVDCSKEHLKKLKSLRHVHLARIVNDRKTRFGREITYESCEGPNLRDYILGNDCAASDLIRFAAQITEAIQYLHSNNIVVCVLNAESIRMVNSSQVKLFGLHFSRSILPSHNELTFSLGIAHGDVDPSMYRWCAKEIIQDGLFSPAGDVWSLGMTILEMFMCLSKDDSAKPFPHYSDDKILDVLKMINCRPLQPALCPDWVYIVVTQCWCLHPIERASPTAVLDCLTQRYPKESYLLQRWMEKNEIHENWPDLNVIQELDNASSISRQDVESSVSDEFADQHTYEYERPFWLKKAFKNLVSKVTSFLPSTSTPQPVFPLPSSNGVSESVMPSPGQPASLAVAGPNSSSLATRKSSIHSRSFTLDAPQSRDVLDIYNSDNENLGQSEEEDRVQYATVESLDLKNATRRIHFLVKGKSEVVHGNEPEQGLSRRDFQRLSTTSLPPPPVPGPDDDDDTYDIPRPDYISIQEFMSLDVEQREEKQGDDGNYDDVFNRPNSGNNPDQKCNTSDKQMKVNLEDDETYDDIKHRPRTGETCEHPNHECTTADPEPQVSQVGESYQELAYSTEEGYMPLIRSSSGLIDESSPSTQTNQAGSGTSVSAVLDDARKLMCCQPVFYMNI